ncbi:hypothetical protein ACE6H2_015600 [Prunus campanulata]
MAPIVAHLPLSFLMPPRLRLKMPQILPPLSLILIFSPGSQQLSTAANVITISIPFFPHWNPIPLQFQNSSCFRVQVILSLALLS